MKLKAVLVASAIYISWGSAGLAACSEIDYSDVNHIEQVNRVLVSAGVAGDFEFDRYQEGFVYNICNKNFGLAKDDVASGVVTLDHAVKIAVRLGESEFATQLEEAFGSSPSKPVTITGNTNSLDADQLNLVKASFENRSLDERQFVQEVLRALGYYSSSQDGKWGAKTQAAVQTYSQEQTSVHGITSIMTSSDAEMLLQQIMAHYDLLEAIGDVEANEG